MRPTDLPWTAAEIAHLREGLLSFYASRARALPWRETRDPWAILISELMLQQTRVETVVPYYRRWIERFPTPRDLADAKTDEVLRYWQGLGYYSRARNLQAAARTMVMEHGGRVPETLEALRALPGVGPYTAGAVASIAYGIQTPAVDGNVRRVFARLLDQTDPTLPWLQSVVGGVVDPSNPGAFNQAIMELGALICTPRSPSCSRCPVAALCRARAAGTVPLRPAPRRRAPVPADQEAVAVVVHAQRILVRRRPDAGLLAGMWEFPGVGVEDEADVEVQALHLAHALVEGLDVTPDEARASSGWVVARLPSVEHVFTHLRRTYLPVRIDLPHGVLEPGRMGNLDRVGDLRRVGEPSLFGDSQPSAQPEPSGELRWVELDELARLPFPVAQQRILRRALEAEVR